MLHFFITTEVAFFVRHFITLTSQNIDPWKKIMTSTVNVAFELHDSSDHRKESLSLLPDTPSPLHGLRSFLFVQKMEKPREK